MTYRFSISRLMLYPSRWHREHVGNIVGNVEWKFSNSRSLLYPSRAGSEGMWMKLEVAWNDPQILQVKIHASRAGTEGMCETFCWPGMTPGQTSKQKEATRPQTQNALVWQLLMNFRVLHRASSEQQHVGFWTITDSGKYALTTLAWEHCRWFYCCIERFLSFCQGDETQREQEEWQNHLEVDTGSI